MATPVTYNGVSYSIPAFGDVGYAQGPGNLSSYLIALASGPQTTGGLFSLTAPLSFGPNFGILAVNFTTTDANPATAGTIRLANTDTIDWRNFANTGNLPLGVNASDQLTFNGAVLSTGTINGTVNTGVAGRLTLYPASGNTVDDVYTQNAFGIDILIAAQAARSVALEYTIPNPGNAVATATFDLLELAQTFTAIKTFSAGAGAITLSASTIAMGGNKITGLANGSAATDAAAFGQITASVAPTIQKFTSGSGTYTTPTSPRGPLYIRVRMAGGGGGGGPSGTTAGTGGGAGGTTTFGTTLLSCNGGGGGVCGAASNSGGAGGVSSLGAGPIGIAIPGSTGQGNFGVAAVSTVFIMGGMGGTNSFGGPGPGGGSATAGGAGLTNTGGGGGGAGANDVSTIQGGSGGGAGGYVDALIIALAATYAYSIGAGGTAGIAGTSGVAGGSGGSGVIIVEEFYQ